MEGNNNLCGSSTHRQVGGELKKAIFSGVRYLEFNGFKQGGITLDSFIKPALVKDQLNMSLK